MDVKLSKKSAKFLRKIPPKHAEQIAKRILLLSQSPKQLQIKELKGFKPYCRLKSGEYRIIFKVESECLHVVFIGKRNDDEIYKMIERFLR